MSADATQEVAVEIDAPLDTCVSAILDFERYPEWSSVIESARIVERDGTGIGRIVEFHLNMRIKTIRYVLEYTFHKPNKLTWRTIEGDLEAVEGHYLFRKLSPARTEARCRQEIRLGFWMPGPLRKLAERTALKQSVDEFKTAAEGLVAGGKKPPAKKTANPKKPAGRARR